MAKRMILHEALLNKRSFLVSIVVSHANLPM